MRVKLFGLSRTSWEAVAFRGKLPLEGDCEREGPWMWEGLERLSPRRSARPRPARAQSALPLSPNTCRTHSRCAYFTPGCAESVGKARPGEGNLAPDSLSFGRSSRSPAGPSTARAVRSFPRPHGRPPGHGLCSLTRLFGVLGAASRRLRCGRRDVGGLPLKVGVKPVQRPVQKEGVRPRLCL